MQAILNFRLTVLLSGLKLKSSFLEGENHLNLNRPFYQFLVAPILEKAAC